MERDKTTSIAVRMPDWILECVDAHLARMNASQRLIRFNRSDALRDLVVRALEAIDPEGVIAAEQKARSGEQLTLPSPLANTEQAADQILQEAQQAEPPTQRSHARRKRQAQSEQ